MQQPEVDVRSLPWHPTPYSLSQVSFWTWRSVLLPDSLASKRSESACLCSQRLELQIHTGFLLGCWRSELRTPCVTDRDVFLPLPVLVFSMWVLLWLWTWYIAEDWPETPYPPPLSSKGGDYTGHCKILLPISWNTYFWLFKFLPFWYRFLLCVRD